MKKKILMRYEGGHMNVGVYEIEEETAKELVKLPEWVTEVFVPPANSPPLRAKPDFGSIQQQPQEEEELEQTEFDVFIIELGAKKMDAVKALRKVSGLHLKDSNAIIKQPLPTKATQDKLSKDVAEEWKKELEGAGCVIEIK